MPPSTEGTFFGTVWHIRWHGSVPEALSCRKAVGPRCFGETRWTRRSSERGRLRRQRRHARQGGQRVPDPARSEIRRWRYPASVPLHGHRSAGGGELKGGNEAVLPNAAGHSARRLASVSPEGTLRSTAPGAAG